MPSVSVEFIRLIEIVARLRAPDGCPWDREQSLESLKPFLLEETYEVLQAIDEGDHRGLCEELGDFLYQAVFLARLEEEAGHFSIADAVQSIADKLVRRHPHVFGRTEGEPALDTAAEVRTRWEEIKAGERGRDAKPKTLLGGIPPALPALLRAHHIGSRAASVGFDWTTTNDVIAKIEEEVREVREVVQAGTPLDRDRAEDEMGDLLFAIANLARQLGIEPESALRRANDKFTRRFESMETSIAGAGRTMKELPLSELEEEWERVKARQRTD